MLGGDNLLKNKTPMLHFTSDHHFGHKKILEYTNRPFETVDEMDEAMIARWNEKVGSDDEVYHLGDVGLSSSGKLRNILDRLNGKIYHIIVYFGKF